MKKIFISMAAIAAALCTISCSKDNDVVNSTLEVPGVTDERIELTVGVGGVNTKSTAITTDDEVKVRDLQVFVFRGDVLDAYTKVSTSTATLSCTAGSRDIYALVNAPDLSTINSKTALLQQTSSISDNLTDVEGVNTPYFVMVGAKPSVTLPQTESINIDVKRIASRVLIKKITNNFTSAAHAAGEFKVKEIYLINAGAASDYAFSVKSTLCNKSAYNNECPELMYDAMSETVVHTQSYDTDHSFYCYPHNDSSNPTRLVVEATWNEKTYYYPITLPTMENNKTYEISELIITRLGSEDPNIPVSFNDCTFEITVQPWTVVAVADSEENDYIKI